MSLFNSLRAGYLFAKAVARGRYVVMPGIASGHCTVYDKATKKYFRQYVRNRFDVITVNEIFNPPCYDLSRLRRWPELSAFHDEVLAGGRTPLILDCGANIGSSAEYFARTFPSAEVVAFEPAPANFALLRRNCTSPNIKPQNAAISSQDGHVSVNDAFEDPRGFQVNTARADGAAGARVPARSMRTVLNEHGPAQYAPFVVKIDIEGFESDLFSKDVDWVDEVQVLIIELHDWFIPRGGTSANFLSTIAGRDRDLVIMGENLVSIRNSPRA